MYKKELILKNVDRTDGPCTRRSNAEYGRSRLAFSRTVLSFVNHDGGKKKIKIRKSHSARVCTTRYTAARQRDRTVKRDQVVVACIAAKKRGFELIRLEGGGRGTTRGRGAPL